MAKTKTNCLNCGKEIYVENKEMKRGYGKFCNRKCSGEHKSKNSIPLPNNVKCALCNTPFHIGKYKQTLSKSGLYFCCRKHKDQAQRIGGIKEIQPSHFGTGAADDARTYRRIAFANKPKQCERCGYNEHEAAIIVHHKDKNRLNCDEFNLEILCANCHAIEHWGLEPSYPTHSP